MTWAVTHPARDGGSPFLFVPYMTFSRCPDSVTAYTGGNCLSMLC